MKIFLEPGTYVVAVSGGVDSMVLLDLLTKLPGLELVVAHFDHQIRPDSNKDAELVAKAAREYGLPVISAAGRLSAEASEAAARTARYDFLQSVKGNVRAQAIITAHHQDDLLETAIINWSRGTGWRGLTALASTDELIRPLLHFDKATLLNYARTHSLIWREDSTNQDAKYLRNYIRLQILPRMQAQQRQQLLTLLVKLTDVRLKLDQALAGAVAEIGADDKLDRNALASLSVPVIKEILITWWRANQFYGYESKTINRSIVTICQGKTGDIVPLKGDLSMVLERHHLALKINER